MRKPTRSLPDTNVLIRYLTRDNEPLYERAKQFFDEVKEGSTRAVILESVIAECIYVLTKIYKTSRDEAAGSLIALLHYNGIANPDREELIRALILYSEHNIDIVDCILWAKASEPEASLFTFDEELNKLAQLD